MSRRNLLLILLVLTLLRGVIYAVVMPPWQAPDETGHFEYAWLIAHLGQLPTGEDVSPTFERELLSSLYEWRYGEYIGRSLPERMPSRMSDLPLSIFARRSRTVLSGRFSLAYLWQVVFLWPFQHQDLAFQLYVARFSSVVLNAAIVWLAYLVFGELVPNRPRLVALMTALVIFLPQHTFINSMVGEGPLAELMVCLALYGWVRLFRRGFEPLGSILIAMGTLVGVWSKPTAAFLIPVDIGFLVWWLLRQRRHGWKRRHVILLCATVLLIGLSLGQWVRSSLGRETLVEVRDFLSSTDLAWTDNRGMTLGEALLSTYDSFWANFGWMAVSVSGRWYGAVLFLSLLALSGWFIDRPSVDQPWSVAMMAGVTLVAFLVFAWVALLSRVGGYYQFQGRYLFPIVVPYAFLFVGGLDRLFPAEANRFVMTSLLFFLICFDAWCLAGTILPYFYS